MELMLQLNISFRYLIFFLNKMIGTALFTNLISFPYMYVWYCFGISFAEIVGRRLELEMWLKSFLDAHNVFAFICDARRL